MPSKTPRLDESARWPRCPTCGHKHEPGSDCPPAHDLLVGVVWLKRPMPDGQWPPDIREPRDDSFSWWVRSACGHQYGHRQWAFYREADADQYEGIFKADPCRYTQCARSKTRGR